jgi:hypothetical protein
MILTAIVLLLLVSLVVIAIVGFLVVSQREQESFYVGVTYCGSSIQEAKELVDKVKDCTNLFILQSGVLQWNATAMEEIGDYVVSLNLSYAVYGGTRNNVVSNSWLNEAKQRWGEQFMGVYYNDEVGGYMLDKIVFLEIIPQIEDPTITPMPKIVKTENGAIILYNYEEDNSSKKTITTTTAYWPDGKIIIEKINEHIITYYPNEIITIFENKKGTFYTTENNNLTKYTTTPILPYEQILKQNPIQTYNDAAKAYVNVNRELLEEINNTQLKQEQLLVFTADYGLQWWDYQSGYDLVLAELAWNNSITQEIALTRGAANLQNKQWGTMITWKYTHPPYLTNGEEMFEQMKISYEAGAKYVVIFNYSEDPKNPNTLQEEHFRALERFWSDVVQNPKVIHGGIKAEAVLVLPQNYGWGMRAAGDNIWGIWSSDDASREIWNQLQNKTEQYGLKLDIVFEDSNYPVIGKYHNIHYWNQK